ncbi:MAG: hypothetical protein QHH02_07915 [Syntrophomonadaceae bacterium]|nr:hypothetical protein [Syntrophomonadaceae bacterium]
MKAVGLTGGRRQVGEGAICGRREGKGKPGNGSGCPGLPAGPMAAPVGQKWKG